jgi:cyclic dehypoxanthinyl futalosine synthase
MGAPPLEVGAAASGASAAEAVAVAAGAIAAIERKVAAGERLQARDALALFRHPNLTDLGAMADEVRRRRHPEPMVTYIVGRNINYTNVCWVRCSFCNFYRKPGEEGGYVLPRQEIFRKIQDMVDLGGVEVLLQGGLNPALKIDYFEDLFRSIKSRFKVHLHALSTSEVAYIAHVSKLSLGDTIGRLRAAGWDTLPGAGAEVLSDEVREAIAPLKGPSQAWLEVMREAHRQGMRTSATLMYGSVETIEQRVEHLQRLRDLQDETGGFTAFIAWSFQSQGTELKVPHAATGFDYLRTTAVSRLFLDNIDHLQASWVTQGPKVGQLSLHFGCDDFGSTMMEENVVSAAGTCFSMPIAEIHRLIEEAGFRPQRRNTLYEWLPTPEPPAAPAARLASASATVSAEAGTARVGNDATRPLIQPPAVPIAAPPPALPAKFEPTPHARRLTRPDALDTLQRTLHTPRDDGGR